MAVQHRVRIMNSSQRVPTREEFGHIRDREAGALLTLNHKGKGGWVTFPFIIGTVMGLSLAAGGWYANITVYAIQKYNVQPISAAQIHNVVGGGVNFFPIVGAILADTFFGSYWVVLVAAFASLLGGVMFILSAAIPHLRPLPCNTSTRVCPTPSSSQYAFLYITLVLGIIGLGGTRFVLGTIGADQYDRVEHQNVYFNWFVLAFESSWVIAFTVIVYVEDNVSWAIGYGISVAASAFAITLFLFGSRFYRLLMPQGSPFVSIARVFIASLRKAKLSTEDHEYFYESTMSKSPQRPPSPSLSFFNQAALVKVAQAQHHKSWSLCTVEEVEDLKKLMKALTIWGAGLLESTIYAVSSSLITIQALVMDRHLGPHFQIPAGSVFVFTLIWASFLLTILDRFLYPLSEKVLGRSLTPLQRVGIGYFFNVSGMVAYAMIESKRLDLIEKNGLMEHNAVAPMSVLWLILPLALLGSGTAFYFPAEVEFYYQEFPKSLRTTSNAMTSLRLAVGYYLSSAIVHVIRNNTTWLPNEINHGRVDKVYWLVSFIGAVNFVIYLLVSKLYVYSSHTTADDITINSRYMDIYDISA
ncbi:protein NRT1/ PTR FAMILY 2.7-like isoform X2 [Silene latifolia]|uniref:protein NRT1/ PTR FAMILY 2.7-like isoform X2 n=1 Tax=Silene latifolia TaxID=37657 RepID=UPI003D76D807